MYEIERRLNARPIINKTPDAPRYLSEPRDNIFMINSGNIKYKIRAIAEINETKIIDFLNIFLVFVPFSNFSEANGNIAFPTEIFENIIAFPIKETNAYWPAISGLKRILANNMSKLYISTMAVMITSPGIL